MAPNKLRERANAAAHEKRASLAALLAMLAASLAIQPIIRAQRVDNDLGYYAPDISVAEVVRARGYTAEVHRFVTSDHYQLELTRAINPLARAARRPAKLPILFVHGILMGGLTFVENSRDVRPRLYDDAALNLASMDVNEVYELVKDDPARRSLVFTALNFGFEPWILSRRGYSEGSRRKLNRPNRTISEALLEVPNTLLAGGFGLTGGLLPGRPQRQPIIFLNRTVINSTQLEGNGGAASSSSSWLDLFGAPGRNLWQALQTAAKLPQSLASLGNPSKQFIDTFDVDFWSYSIDEQAEFDLPESVDYVLKVSNAPKLHLVSFSAGGAITLLALASKPALADKISRHVAYAPALNLGSRMGINFELADIIPFIQAYTGPLPFLFQEYEIKTALQQICSTPLNRKTVCEAVLDVLFGFTAGQEPTTVGFYSGVLDPTPSRELFQLGQFAHSQRPCKFRFDKRAMNVAAYGGTGEPPCYDLGRIRLLNMSIYAGQDDDEVAPDAVATTVVQLRVPVELHVVGDKRIHFNHLGNELHVDNDRLVLLPSLLDIARSEAQEPATRRAA